MNILYGISIKEEVVREVHRTVKSLQAFIFISRLSFLNSLIFRANYFVDILSNFLFLYLSIELWTYIYSDSNVGNSLGLLYVLSYVSIARTISKTDMDFVWHIQNRVLNGEIASELVRPIKLSSYLMAQEIGRYIGHILLKVMPVYVCTLLFFDIYVPSQLVSFVLLFISVVLSFFLLFYINYITAIMAFWITKLFSLSIFKDQTIRLLSGSIVPLWFFPAQWIPVLQFLPFSGITYVPVSIYLETNSIEKTAWLILSQLFWIFALSLASRRLWSRAVRNISINGG